MCESKTSIIVSVDPFSLIPPLPPLTAQFEVVGTRQSSHIKLRNVANPKFYLAITGGYFIGYVSSTSWDKEGRKEREREGRGREGREGRLEGRREGGREGRMEAHKNINFPTLMRPGGKKGGRLGRKK